MSLPEPLEQLITLFKRFPGVGEKSARRMAFCTLQQPDSFVESMAEALVSIKKNLGNCSVCGNITDTDPCSICTDPFRDRKTICVVESAEDLISMEQAGIFNGLYHVLGGKVSPLDDEQLDPDKLSALKRRVRELSAREVIIATNPRIEGDLTFFEIASSLKEVNVKISRLAYGLPVGGSIEFADRVTLHAALESRVDIERE